MKPKKTENQFKVLTSFEQGQLDAMRWVKNNIQKELALIENMTMREILYSTQQDILFAGKCQIKKAVLEGILANIETAIKGLQNKEN